MYRRPKFLEVLLEIRQEMAREADYDVNLFTEMVVGGNFPHSKKEFSLIELPLEKQNNDGKSNKNRKSQL